MPDKHGFNHLGDSVRCIDCPTGGPLGHWPEHKRARHARTRKAKREGEQARGSKARTRSQASNGAQQGEER